MSAGVPLGATRCHQRHQCRPHQRCHQRHRPGLPCCLCVVRAPQPRTPTHTHALPGGARARRGLAMCGIVAPYGLPSMPRYHTATPGTTRRHPVPHPVALRTHVVGAPHAPRRPHRTTPAYLPRSRPLPVLQELLDHHGTVLQVQLVYKCMYCHAVAVRCVWMCGAHQARCGVAPGGTG